MRHRPLHLPLSIVLACTLVACSDRTVTAPAAPAQASLNQGGAPAPVPEQPPLDATGSAICGFPIYQQYTGSLKILQLPSGSMVALWPGLQISLTNGDTQKSVTLPATASQEYNFLPDGNIEVVARGPQGIYVLETTPQRYLFVTGLSRYVIASDGTMVEPLTVRGSTQDVCELLS